jgi:hypothetical protein
MEIFEILSLFMLGGLNFISSKTKHVNKNAKPMFTISDKERLNNALPVFKSRQ